MENFTDLGLKVGFIVLCSITALLLVISVAAAIAYRRSEDSYSGWDVPAILGGVFTMVMGVVTLLYALPFQSQYLHLYRVSGEVTSVSNVLSESGGDLTRTPVLTVEGIDRDITVDDPRAVNLQGKTVDFTCTVGWNYQAADSYGCKIYDIKK